MHLVIFDLDGTLTQTYYAGDNSFMKALSRFIPVENDYPYWKECNHLTDEAVFQHVFQKITGKPASKEDKERMQDQFMVELMHKYKHSAQFFDPIPGALRFIQELKQESGVVLGIATGSWEKIARFKLELAGFQVNDFLIYGSDSHLSKVDFTQALIQEVNTKHSVRTTTYVGDSLYDYGCAKTLGLNFIGIDYLQTGQFNAFSFIPVYEDFRDLRLVI